MLSLGLRRLGISYIEKALEKLSSGETSIVDKLYDWYVASYAKTSADIRPGDAKPPVDSDRQSNNESTVVDQLIGQNSTPIQEEDTPKVLPAPVK